MKVLIVCSGNKPGFDFEKDMAFVFDQVEAIKNHNHEIQFYTWLVKGKGIKGYLKQRSVLKSEMKKIQPDLIHTHGGHLGAVTLFQGVPNVVTFHGSEINNVKLRFISTIVSVLTDFSIFVSKILFSKLVLKPQRSDIIPCGVDIDQFYPLDSALAKKALNIDESEKYILFTSSFDNKVKNFPLAERVMKDFPEYRLREVKNRSRMEVNLLINGAEALLMTSFSEGSPQIIKEALACNQRIVSVRVGDVEEQLKGVSNSIVCNHDKDELSKALKWVLKTQRAGGREKASEYDNKMIAKKIEGIYKSLL